MGEGKSRMRRWVEALARFARRLAGRPPREGSRRRAGFGMTLIEIMVVIAIIGMIMGAVAVAVVARTKKAKEGTARIKAQKVYEAAAEFYISAPPGTGCPTLEDLIQAEVIKAAQTKDDWGREFEIRCEGDVVSEVRSAGADGNPGNDDDIVFSEQQEEER